MYLNVYVPGLQCESGVVGFFRRHRGYQFVSSEIVQADAQGFSLVPYPGSDKDKITVGSEMNKIAANIGIGRNHAAVHWRSDYADSLPLGDAIAISVLKDQKATYNESFSGFIFTKFDGTRITV